LLLPRRSRWK